jgi:hypothetical protein
MDEPSPIKDRLYQTLQAISESKIQEEMTSNPTSLIQKILENTNIDTLDGDRTNNYETFAESLMHYLLTNALIPSQRKVKLGQVEIDIVIPDIRTLRTSNDDAIVIVFPKTNDKKSIQQRLQTIQEVQPATKNIWLVQKSDLGLPYKTYEIDGTHTFYNIITDIRNATAGKSQSRLKIFKV